MGAAIRLVVDPRLVPPAKAARRLGLTLDGFRGFLPALRREGFPLPCPVTGHYDLLAIYAYLDQRAGIGAGRDERKEADRRIRDRLSALYGQN